MPTSPSGVTEIEGLAIVVIGNFNPSIFHPTWFAQQELLGADEVEASYDAEALPITTPEFSRFSADWFNCQVLTDRLELSTTHLDALESLRDVAQAVLTILSHTPVAAFGLNHNAHHAMPDEDAWHRLADVLVPKPHWQELLYGRVGMKSVNVISGPREHPAGYTQVVVQPSVPVDFGIYIGVNDHYEISAGTAEAEGMTESLLAARTIGDVWQSSLDLAATLNAGLLELK